ncbi:MAG TPA: glycosyltransferase family 4 protein [Acidimicrobiales bacterium]|jgi:glycosyltransferase involved in cell wall biosynthesis|nr:glycosyltransferase family 4 protein [Acidimicrobiales bacterium]
MKVAYVVPRYGLEVVGGAELGARMLAERLVSQLGWEAEVLTTCALDSHTWADEYQPGTVELNGVVVHRFRSAAGRDPGFERFSRRVLLDPARASVADQERWIDLQGPVNPSVVDAVGASDADAVVFYPYLYHPTVRGLAEAGGRAVMHPAAHDEQPLRLPIMAPVFAGARGLVFQTWGERRLVEGLFPVGATRQLVLGLGIEEAPGEPGAARAALDLGDRPYLVCVGRVDDGKGTGMLARFFAAYKDRHPGPLALVLAGPVVDRPPAHPDIVLAGRVDEATKWGLLRGAAVLIQPSAYEAFSLVLVEAWTAEVPVVVNARCLATREHCERSGGGLWFDGYAHFEAVLDRLLGDPGLAATLAHRGRAYVDAHYRWPVLIERYGAFLEAVAARA